MKILNNVGSVIFYLLVVILAFLAYGSINNRWYRVIIVEGNSMSPTVWAGDLIVVTPPPKDIPPNTIVTMRIAGSLVTHRLLGFNENHYPITKGDANETNDQFQNPDLTIVGVYQLRLPGLGYPLIFLSHLLGRA